MTGAARGFPLLRRLDPGTEAHLVGLGLTSYAEVIRFELADRLFDLRRGVRTGGIVSIADLAIPDPEAQRLARRHKASPPYSVARAFARLSDELGGLGGETLVEYGAGAGRVMILAAEAGFGRAIGVEYAPELARLCRANLERYGARREPRTAFEVVEGDAARYDPPDDARAFYLFRPFKPPVFEAVLGRIRASVARAPREVYLLTLACEHFEKPGLARLGRVNGIEIHTNRTDPAAFLAGCPS